MRSSPAMLVKACALLFVALLCTACRGGGGAAEQGGPRFTTSPMVSTVMSGELCTWTLNWNSTEPSSTVDWDFGAGATPSTMRTIGAGTSSVEVRLAETVDVKLTATYNFTVSDASGSVTINETYEVWPISSVLPAVIQAEYDPQTEVLTVRAQDFLERQLAVEIVTDPPGVGVDTDDSTKLLRPDGSVQFLLDPDFIYDAGSALVGFVAHAGEYQSELFSRDLIETVGIPDDTVFLMAAWVDDDPRFPPHLFVTARSSNLSHGFRDLNAFGLLLESGGEYIPGTFGIGGEAERPPRSSDGIWSSRGDFGVVFNDWPNSELPQTDLGNGFDRWDLHGVPVGFDEISNARGELFQLRVIYRGTEWIRLGIVGFDGEVNRTFYSGDDLTPQYWLDTSNSRGDQLVHAVPTED